MYKHLISFEHLFLCLLFTNAMNSISAGWSMTMCIVVCVFSSLWGLRNPRWSLWTVLCVFPTYGNQHGCSPLTTGECFHLILYYLLNIFSSRFFLQRLKKGSGMWPFLCWGVKWWLLMLSALNTCLAQRRSPSPPKGLVTIKLLPKSVPESGLRGLGKRWAYDLASLSFFLISSLFACKFPCVFLCRAIQSLASWSFSHRWISAWNVARLTQFCPRQEVPW